MNATAGSVGLDSSIQASIQGDVTGQLAIGTNIVQIGAVHGDVIYVALQRAPSPRPRPRPVQVRPRPFPGFLDRQSERATATAAMLAGEPLEFVGESGVGKTSLLRVVAHQPAIASAQDGIVWLRVGDQPLPDVLQTLFDALYDWDQPTKATDTQIQHALNITRAVILCDDVDLSREDVERLLDTASACTFVLTSSERQLWGMGRSLPIHGLPVDEAVMLFERGLERSLETGERDVALSICTALLGHPLRVLQIAALARARKLALAHVAVMLRTAGATTTLNDQVVGLLPEAHRRVLAVLVALGGMPVGTQHVGAIAGVANPERVVQVLADLRLVGAAEGYRVTGIGLDAVPWWGLDQVRGRALSYFAGWAEANRRAPAVVLEEADAIRWLVRWGTDTGAGKEVIRLGRAVDGAFALGCRWGAWKHVLDSVLESARAVQSLPDQAWVLHQLGTRSACLGDRGDAIAALREALQLRARLGDHIGAAITRHNLGVVLGPSGGSEPPPPASSGPGGSRFWPLAGITLLVVVLVGGGAWVVGGGGEPPTPVVPMTSPTVTQTVVSITGTTPADEPPTDTPIPPPTGTTTPTATSTDTPTATATATATATQTATATPDDGDDVGDPGPPNPGDLGGDEAATIADELDGSDGGNIVD